MLQIDSCTYHTNIPVVCTMPFGPGNMFEAAFASRQFFSLSFGRRVGKKKQQQKKAYVLTFILLKDCLR